MCVLTNLCSHNNMHMYLSLLFICRLKSYGPGSSIGIATDYRLDGPGSNPSGDEISRPSRTALGPTQPPVQWVLDLSRGWRRPGRGADPPLPSSVPRS